MADQRARRERALADGPLAGGLAQRRFDEFVGLAIGCLLYTSGKLGWAHRVLNFIPER